MAKGRCHTYSASFDLNLLLPVSWFILPPLLLFLSFLHSHPTYFAYWHHKTDFFFQPPRACWVNGSLSLCLLFEVWLLFLLLISCVLQFCVWSGPSPPLLALVQWGYACEPWMGCQMMYSIMALMDDRTLTCITHQLELLAVCFSLFKVALPNIWQ